MLLFQIKMPQIFENKYLHGHTLLFFLGKYLESGIHVSYSKYIFTLRNCQIVSQSTYNILHSHEHFIRLSFAPHFHQNLFLLVFLILFILGVTYWYLTIVLTLSSYLNLAQLLSLSKLLFLRLYKRRC